MRVQSFALVGTMSYEKGQVAFFDGSGSEFRKAVRQGETIAGHTVREITQKSVRMEQDGKTVELKVNSQLRREEDGPWVASARTESYSGGGDGGSSESKPAGSGSASSSGSSSSSSSADVNEVLKRLMEQREKEMK